MPKSPPRPGSFCNWVQPDGWSSRMAGPAEWLVRARDVRTPRPKNRDVSRPGRRLSEHGCIAAVRSLRRLPRCPVAVRPPPPDYLPATFRRDTAPRGELRRSMRGAKSAGITFCGTTADGAAGCFEARLRLAPQHEV